MSLFTIVPTIDVEGTHGSSPFEQMVLGEIGDSDSWGVYRLARIFRDFGVVGTFFVDVYEYTLWGEAPLRQVCERLTELGQDVQLHTHPAWRDDPADSRQVRELKKAKSFLPQQQDFMAKLSEDLQAKVLEHGGELLERWTGRRPFAHRGGGYSINGATLRALRRTGFSVDSSMNSAHPHSEETWSCNRLVQRDGILEMPVTVMDYCFGFGRNGAGPCLYSKRMKTDLDSSTLSELRHYVAEARRLGLKFMNLFMHSYSLLNFDYFYRRFAGDPRDEEKLRRFLRWACDQADVQVKSVAAYAAELRDSPGRLGDRDAVPCVTANAHIARLGFSKIVNVAREAILR